MSLQPNKIRIAVGLDTFNRNQKDSEGRPIAFWRGSPVRIEVAFIEKKSIASVLGIVSLTFQLKEGSPQRGKSPIPENAPLVSKTISEFNNELTENTWVDGTQQHAIVDLSGAEMNIAASAIGGSYMILLAQVEGIAEPVTLVSSPVGIWEDGYSDAAGSPPDPVENYLSAQQTAALIEGKVSKFEKATIEEAELGTGDGWMSAELTKKAIDALAPTGEGNPNGGGDVSWEEINNKPSTFPPVIGSGAGDAVAGNDARLADSRTPTAHKISHATGGDDPLTPEDIGAATAAQGLLADTAIQPEDPALSDAREWVAETMSEEEAVAGTSTTRRAITAQRLAQAIAALAPAGGEGGDQDLTAWWTDTLAAAITFAGRINATAQPGQLGLNGSINSGAIGGTDLLLAHTYETDKIWRNGIHETLISTNGWTVPAAGTGGSVNQSAGSIRLHDGTSITGNVCAFVGSLASQGLTQFPAAPSGTAQAGGGGYGTVDFSKDIFMDFSVQVNDLNASAFKVCLGLASGTSSALCHGFQKLGIGAIFEVDGSNNLYISAQTLSFNNTGSITVTDTTPITVSVSGGNLGFETGDWVRIDRVTGNTAANGVWQITKLSDTSYSLDGSSSNGEQTGSSGTHARVTPTADRLVYNIANAFPYYRIRLWHSGGLLRLYVGDDCNPSAPDLTLDRSPSVNQPATLFLTALSLSTTTTRWSVGPIRYISRTI